MCNSPYCQHNQGSDGASIVQQTGINGQNSSNNEPFDIREEAIKSSLSPAVALIYDIVTKDQSSLDSVEKALIPIKTFHGALDATISVSEIVLEYDHKKRFGNDASLPSTNIIKVVDKRVLGPIGRVIDGAEIANHFRKGEVDIALQKSGGLAGASAGGYLGAKAGATIGALIGTAFPVVGTIIGGLVGGVVGGIIGSALGYFLGANFVKDLMGTDSQTPFSIPLEMIDHAEYYLPGGEGANSLGRSRLSETAGLEAEFKRFLHREHLVHDYRAIFEVDIANEFAEWMKSRWNVPGEYSGPFDRDHGDFSSINAIVYTNIMKILQDVSAVDYYVSSDEALRSYENTLSAAYAKSEAEGVYIGKYLRPNALSSNDFLAYNTGFYHQGEGELVFSPHRWNNPDQLEQGIQENAIQYQEKNRQERSSYRSPGLASDALNFDQDLGIYYDPLAKWRFQQSANEVAKHVLSIPLIQFEFNESRKRDYYELTAIEFDRIHKGNVSLVYAVRHDYNSDIEGNNAIADIVANMQNEISIDSISNLLVEKIYEDEDIDKMIAEVKARFLTGDVRMSKRSSGIKDQIFVVESAFFASVEKAKQMEEVYANSIVEVEFDSSMLPDSRPSHNGVPTSHNDVLIPPKRPEHVKMPDENSVEALEVYSMVTAISVQELINVVAENHRIINADEVKAALALADSDHLTEPLLSYSGKMAGMSTNAAEVLDGSSQSQEDLLSISPLFGLNDDIDHILKLLLKYAFIEGSRLAPGSNGTVAGLADGGVIGDRAGASSGHDGIYIPPMGSGRTAAHYGNKINLNFKASRDPAENERMARQAAREARKQLEALMDNAPANQMAA